MLGHLWAAGRWGAWWSLPGEQGQETQGQSPGVPGSRRTQPSLHTFLDTLGGTLCSVPILQAGH